MAENSVKYYVRIDNSYVETDLETAQKKIKSAGRSANNELEQQGKKSADAIGVAADDAAGKMVQASRKGSQSFQDISTSAGKADKSIDDIDADSLTEVKKQAEDTSDALGKMGESAEGAAGKTGAIGGAVSKMGSVVGGALLGIGGAAVAVGKQAVSSAMDLDQAMNQFAASTGVTNDKLGDYEETLKNIYANNYGESFEDIAGAMQQVRSQIGPVVDSWDPTELQNFTESAFVLRDTFEYDVSESVRAANAMMTNFGIDGEQAMNLIAEGAQNGLDFSGEMLDSISEYSVQFAKVGMDADDMFAIMQKGAESGAFNLDKVGDAIKEMSIRVVDGSDTTKAGFEALGLNADEMAAKFAAGGDTAKEAFDQTIQALANMEDPLEQNTAGVNLFGTTWEDLGPDVVTALAGIEDSAYSTTDAMNEIKDVKYDDLQSQMDSLKRSLELLIVPLGEALLPLLGTLLEALQPLITTLGESLKPIIDQISEVILVLSEPLGKLVEFLGSILGLALEIISAVLTPVLDLITQLLEPLMQLLTGILDPLMSMLQSLMEPLLSLINAALQPILNLISALIEPLMSLVSAILPPIQSLFSALTPILQTLFSALEPIFNIFSQIASIVGDVLGPVIETLAGIFSQVLGGALDAIMPIIENVMDIFGGLIDFITGVFSGNWEQAWNGIVDMFKGIFNLIPTIVEGIINGAISIINGIIWGINQLTGLIGIPAIPEIPKVSIPRFKVGIDYVPSDMFPAFLDKGERVLTAEENAQYTALGGLSGLEARYAAIRQPSLPESPSLSIPQGKYIAQIHVDLDGREVARATAPFMGSQLSWEEF